MMHSLLLFAYKLTVYSDLGWHLLWGSILFET